MIDLDSICSIDRIGEAVHTLRNVVSQTPLSYDPALSERYDANILLKREDLQNVRSFKIRGAYNKLASLTEEEIAKGVVCASAGNHAQGVAYSCFLLKIKAKIFMPETTPKQKISKVEFFGKSFVEVILAGDDFDSCYQSSLVEVEQNDAMFIHPFNDPDVIAGQGTIAKEILNVCSEPIDYLLAPIGGGGLISGLAIYFKGFSPETKIIGVESAGAPAMFESLKANKPVCLDKIDSFADGIAVKNIGANTFEICNSYLEEVLLVPEGKICSTIISLHNEEAIVLEPAGAAVIAALDNIAEEIKNKTVVLIISGGNNDINRTEEIRERALLYEGKKHYFIIKFPQRAGALREFLNVLGPNDDITHFEYTKKNNRESGPALVGIELKYKGDYESLLNNMAEKNINFVELNKDPLLFEMFV